jgi:large subunit ribosomal protein L21|tara:strand:- start:1883 stop:2095 length:213 start_codon:yes stop_codon:yes gene_type:complete
MSFLEKFKQFVNFNRTTTSDKKNKTESTGTTTTTDYSSLKVTELKALAKERGYTGYSNLRKTQLIELLNK